MNSNSNYSIEDSSAFINKTERSGEILLVEAPMWDKILPPLGISYISSFLEVHHFENDVLDLNIELHTLVPEDKKKYWDMTFYNSWAWEGEFNKLLTSIKEYVDYYIQKILSLNYKIVCFSLSGANDLCSAYLANELKRLNPNIYIIFGGPSCLSIHDNIHMPIRPMVSGKTGHSFLGKGVVNSFVLGEGEETMLEVIESYFKNEFYPIKGAIMWIGDKYVHSLPRAYIHNLDVIPFPNWKKLPHSLYTMKTVLPLLLSRGCINKCRYCNDWKIWGGIYRVRSAKNIFAEMKYVRENFPDKNVFQCNDLTVNANLNVLSQLSDLIIESGLDIHWNGQGMTHPRVTLDLMKRLRSSGFDQITYGVEHLSENVLKSMNKIYSFENILNALKYTKEAGVKIFVNFLVGFPTETEEDFQLLKSRLPLIKDYVDAISSLSPCYLNANIDLEINPNKYGMTFPHENRHMYWESQNGKNTYKVRKRRVKELYDYAQELGIEVKFLGIYDEC